MGVLQLGFGLFQLAAIAFAVTFFAVLFWGSVRIVEADNPHNKFSSALAWGGVHLIASFMLSWSEMFGLIGMAAWLVFMLRLLVDFYGLGLLKSIAAIAIANGAPFLTGPIIARVFLTSELGALVFLFGFPAVTIIVWQTAVTRERIALRALDRAPARRKPDADDDAPVARPSAPRVRDATGPSPVIAAPVIAPPVIAPPVIVPVPAAAGAARAPITAAALPPPFATPRPSAVPPPLPLAAQLPPQAAPPMVPGATPVAARAPAGPPAPLVVPPAPIAVPVFAPQVRPGTAPSEIADEPSGPVGEPTFLR